MRLLPCFGQEADEDIHRRLRTLRAALACPASRVDPFGTARHPGRGHASSAAPARPLPLDSVLRLPLRTLTHFLGSVYSYR